MADTELTIRKINAAEEKRKETCREQLAQDRQRLLLKWPFIGGLIMRMELIPVRDDRLKTASTNGESIFVDIDFYHGLTAEERLFVLAHEVWHTALMHFARKGSRDHKLFNYAADLEIHFTLLDEKLTEPWVLEHNPTWQGLSAEEIYEKLLQSLPETGSVIKSKGRANHASSNTAKGRKSRVCKSKDHTDQSSDSKTDTPVDHVSKVNDKFGDSKSSFDKHVYSGQDNIDDTTQPPNDDTSQQTPQNGAKQPTHSSVSSENGEKSHEIVMDDDYNPEVPAGEVEQVRSRIIATAQQIERTQGRLPANLKGLLAKLEKPQLPWQELLKQFVSSCYGGKRQWLPPSRRHVWQDLYLPSMREQRLNAVVALDTSGSTQQDLGFFFGELISLMKSFGKFALTVIQCDATIQKIEHFCDDNPPEQNHHWDVNGLGGTDFTPVFDYLSSHQIRPDVMLYFTDGYGDAPLRPPSYPVMWVLTSDGRKPATWGRSVHFKQPDLYPKGQTWQNE